MRPRSYTDCDIGIILKVPALAIWNMEESNTLSIKEKSGFLDKLRLIRWPAVAVLLLVISVAFVLTWQLLTGSVLPGLPPPGLSYLENSNPAEVDNSRLPVTPTAELNITGNPPDIDIDEYELVIDGLVSSPQSFTYQELMEYPAITRKVLLICPGLFVNNAVWTGIPVKTLLEEAGVQPDAFILVFRAADGYSKYITIDSLDESDVFLAYGVNGEVLPREHGYPLRLVIEGEYGNKWVKWVERIEVM